MKKRGKKSELALTDHLLLTFTHLRHYPTFAGLGAELGISEYYANKIYQLGACEHIFQYVHMLLNYAGEFID